jgi:hypothetical protein
MKKRNAKSDVSLNEKSVSDLMIKKLTLKTGVKAGLAGTCETSCCACTCHSNQTQ